MINQKEPHPEYIRGFHEGLHQGYNIAIEDFKIGLRSIWKRDENGNYKITEKFHHVDKDEAAMSGATFEANGKMIVLSPEQIQKFLDKVKELVETYFRSLPHMVGKFHPHSFLIPSGTETKNWGKTENFKILILKSPFGIQDHIPESEVMYFVDYEP